MSTRNERVTVGSIAAGGAGVARAKDGRVLFVQRTAPGDEALVRIPPSRKRWSRAQLVNIIQPGPDRRAALCPHYERCGGCTIEHLVYDAQLRAKSEIVRDALRRIGGFDVDAPFVVASPTEFRYRNRLSFTLRRLPAHVVVAGFHEIDHADNVIDITESCLLPEAPLAAVWSEIRAAWGDWAARLPSGPEIRLTVRTTDSGDASLLVDGGYGSGQPEVLLKLVPKLRSIWHRPRPEEDARLLAGDEFLEEHWNRASVRVGGAMFLQVNRATARLLEDYVIEKANAAPRMRVVDAYCGVGLHARRLAERGALVTGIELDPHAAAEARHNGVDIVEAKVEDALPITLPAELVILNPPRGGIDIAVVQTLINKPPSRIIYVSCDPATLARDLSRLRDRFTIDSIRCFDMFPQTTHVETVVELVCSTT
jgi:23S rRNA (uracil1939-C5)-methyltransferase